MALSVLDFPPDGLPAEDSEDMAAAWQRDSWSRWSTDLLRRLSPARDGDEGIAVSVLDPLLKLDGNRLVKEALGFFDPLDKDAKLCCVQTENSIHALLQRALSCAIGRVVRHANERLEKRQPANRESFAGAIYLDNPFANELVMSASEGYPNKWDDKRWDKEDNPRPGRPPKAPPNNLEITTMAQWYYAHLTVLSKLARQPAKYHTMVCPRGPWVKRMLEALNPGNTATKPEKSGLDCNSSLVGVAYYSLDDPVGITTRLYQLRNRGEVPERDALERDFLRDPGEGKTSWQTVVSEALGNPVDPRLTQLLKSQIDHLTVAYLSRDELGIGRQVRAGVYESLQFPDPSFVGPFMGTVLCFRGERLGILKVERHWFPDGPPANTEERVHAGFKPREIAELLIVAYALAGILYILKNHAGSDLTAGWTGHVPPRTGPRLDEHAS
jgi:hypothetical protein